MLLLEVIYSKSKKNGLSYCCNLKKRKKEEHGTFVYRVEIITETRETSL